jgi:hypothetical protein
VNSLQLFRLALGVVLMCSGAAGLAQAPHEMCISAGTLSTQTQVLASQDGSISRSDIALDALLFSRELLSEPDSYWLGFQLVGTSIANGEDAIAPLF